MPAHRSQVNPGQGAKMLVQSDNHLGSAATDANALADQLAAFFATIESTNELQQDQSLHAPRIIAVGAASAETKSLLEAISLLPFPAGAKVRRVGVSGPRTAPRLTLIDQGDSPDNGSAKQQAETAEQYLGRENSINMVVISTPNELALGTVIDKIREYDPQLERTVGVVVVKSDDVEDEARCHDLYLKLALNQHSTSEPTLGWYVLASLPGKGVSTPELELDVAATNIFESEPWKAIQPQNRGIENLRAKVTTIILAQTLQKLPGVVAQIKQAITRQEIRLSELGDHRACWANVRSNFQDLAREALRGQYMNPFFGGLYQSLSDASYEDRRIKKFRALVKDLNRAFSYVMHTRGHRRHILRGSGGDAGEKDNGDDALEPPNYLAPLVDLYGARHPDPTPLHEVESELESIAPENQGTGFTASMHDILTLSLFRDQVQPWRSIANRHIELVTHFAKRFAIKLLSHVAACDVKTGEGLVKAYIDPYFDRKAVELSAKLDELLYHYQHGYDLQQLDTTIHGPLDQAVNDHPPGVHRPTFVVRDDSSRCSSAGTGRIVESMAAYYTMSLKVFIDNVVVLAVENCLIRDIPNILSQDTVGMSDKDWQKLISELRDQVQKGVSQLQKALAASQRIQLSHSTTSGISSDIPLRRPAANPPSRIRVSKPSRASLSPAPSASASASGQLLLKGSTSTGQPAKPETSQPFSSLAAPKDSGQASSKSTVATVPSTPDPVRQASSVPSELASRPKSSTAVVSSPAPSPTAPKTNPDLVASVADGTVSTNASNGGERSADFARAQPPSGPLFGNLPAANAPSLFGSAPPRNAAHRKPDANVFGTPTVISGTSSFGSSAGTAASALFGGSGGSTNKTTTTGFGTSWATPSTTSLFGSSSNKSS